MSVATGLVGVAGSPVLAPAGAAGTASIGDKVFEDFSGNGVADTGEPGRAGVRVGLTGAGVDGSFGTGDDVNFTPVLTGAAGAYSFSELDAGLYRVAVTAPPGFGSTTPVSIDVTLSADQSYTTADFGVLEGDASIGDAVFDDADGSGARDGTETGRGGVGITLKRGATPVATTTTAVDGSYSFLNLPAGSYTVTADLPTDLSLTSLLNPYPVELAAGDRYTSADFGIRSTGGFIGDAAFIDLNANGTADSGEPPLANLMITLTQGSTVVAATRTSLNGTYSFPNLTAGSYTVSPTAPPGSTITTGNSLVSVTLTSGQVVSNVDFGYAGVSFVPGAVTTIAGNGANATLDGTGTGASFSELGGIAVVNGSAYQFTKGAMRKVRLVDGVVTTLAGDATATGCTDSMNPAAVRFETPTNVATDGTSLFVLDCGKVRKIDIATGATSTLTSSSRSGSYHLAYQSGFLYVSSGLNSSVPTIYKVDPVSGATMMFATLPPIPGSELNWAGGLASDASALYVLEASYGTGWQTHAIQRVDLATAAVTTLASGDAVGGAPCSNCADNGALVSLGGYLYGSSGTQSSVLRRWSKTDGSMNPVAGADITLGATQYQDGVGPEAWLQGSIRGLATDGTALVVSDHGNRRVRQVLPAAPHSAAQSPTATQTVGGQEGASVTFAGSGADETTDGIGPFAAFKRMGDAVVVGDYVYVGTTNAIRKVNRHTGVVATLAGFAGLPTDCVDSPAPASVRFSSANEGRLTTDGTFLYLADTVCHRVRRISLATGATSFVSHIFSVSYISFAPDGYLYAASSSSSYGGLIFRIDPATGVTTTFKAFAATDYSRGLVADGQYLWAVLVPSGTGLRSLLRISLADGSATVVRSDIDSMDLDSVLMSAGDYLYSTGPLGASIRRFSKVDGSFIDVAGSGAGTRGYVEDVGASARFSGISGIASDGERLWVNDSENRRLRVFDDLEYFDPQSPQFGFDEYGVWSDDVNVGLGNFVTAETDLTVAGVGPELGVTRTYNSLDPRVGAFGQGWSFNYDITWIADPVGNVSIIYPDGRREVHTKNGGNFEPPPSYYSKLQSNGSGGYTLTQKDGQIVAFSAAGKATSITDANGFAVNLSYDTGGRLATATSMPSGRILAFTWGGNRIASVATQPIAAYGHALTWTYTYSGASLTKACNPRDAGTGPPLCTRYSYTVGRLSTITKPRGNTAVEVHYADDGKVDWRKDGMGHVTRVMYPAPGVVRVIDPRGSVTKYEFDTTNFRETKETDPSGAVTSFRYDAGGNRDQVTDPNLGVTSYVFDARRNITQQTNAEGKVSYFSYDANDNVTAVRDPRSASSADNAYKTSFTYSTARNKLTQTSPATSDFPSGTAVTWAYTTGTEAAIGGGTMPAGLVKTETDARGGVVTNSYDSKGDLRRVVDRAGLQADYTYDELGRKLTETHTSDPYPAGLTTTTTYDELGQILTVTGPSVTNAVSGAAHRLKLTNTFDANENRSTLTLADIVGTDVGRTSTFEFDNNDREVAVTDPEYGRITRVYDPAGNVVLVTDQNGHSRESTYDTRSLPTALIDRNVVDDPLASTAPRTITEHTYTYDPARRQLTDTDALGRQRGYTYDKLNRQTKVELVGYHNPDGSTRTVTLNELIYDPAGQVTTEKTGGGLRVVSNVWDAARRLTSSTLDPGAAPKLNRTTSYTYDANANVTKALLSDGTRTDETRFAFDAADRVTSRIVEYSATADLITKYTYDKRGLLTSIVAPKGNISGGTAANFKTEYTNDELGRPKTITAPTVSVESNGGPATNSRPVLTYGYDTYGDRTHTKDPRNNVTTASFDKLARQTGIAYPAYTIPGGPTLTPAESFHFDPVGNLTAQVDRRGQRTDNVFDSLNRVRRQTDPLVTGQTQRGVVATEWDDAGNRTATVDQTGALNETAYDDLDRPRTSRQILRQPTVKTLNTSYDYDDLGNQTLATDPLGHSTLATYDAASEMTSRVDPLAKVTTYTYDVGGRLTATTDPMTFKLVNTYDNAGRLASEIQRKTGATDIVTSYTRDENDSIIGRTSPRGFVTTYTYDALNKLRTIVEPVTSTTSITTRYGYDAAGNTTRVTDGRSNVTVATYQAWNLREDIVEPSTTAYPNATDRTYRNSYDAGGLTTNVSLPGGVNRQRTYDELGRMTAETGIQPGQPNITRALGYDLASRQTSGSHPNGTINLAWDDRGLLLGTSGGAGTSSFVYDDANRMTSRTDATGTSTFTWTNRDELQTETDPLTNVTRSNAWDDSGRLSTVALAPGSETRTYGYDAYHRLTSDTLKNAASTTLAAFTYGYDPSGNITNKATTLSGNAGAGANIYTYSLNERLSTWKNPAGTTATYTWDNSGNRTKVGTATSTYDARNRLLAAPSSTSYAYTARGTRVTRTVGSTVTNYAFDAFDRLTSYNGSTSYTYDAYDRIATRAGTNFTYAGTELDPVTTGSPYSYAHSPNGDLIALSDGVNARVAGQDRHGDIAWLLNAPAATVTDTRAFNPFGQSTGTTGTMTPPVGYQSDYTDPTSGLVDMGARWYEPSTDNFISRDTITPMLRTPVSLNMYTYAANNPLNYMDPDGRMFGWAADLADAVGCRSCARTIRHIDRAVRAFVEDVYRQGRDHIIRPLAHYATSGAHSLSAAAQRSIGFIKGGIAVLNRSGGRVSTAALNFAAKTTSGFAHRVSSVWSSCMGSSGCRTFLGAAAVAGGTVLCATATAGACLVPVLAGAAVGGVMGGGIGVATCGGDAGCIAGKAGIGALGGGAAGLGYGAAAALGGSFAAAGAGSGFAGEAANQLVAGHFNAQALVLFTAAGAVLGGIASRFSGAATPLEEVTSSWETAQNAADRFRARLVFDQRGSISLGGGAIGAPRSTSLADDGLALCRSNSFVPATLVLMADGTTRPIADVQVGDLVMATDPETGERGPRKVTDTIVGDGIKELVDIEIDGHVITATDRHPFWVDDEGRWVDAEDLEAGDVLLLADGDTVPVDAARERTEVRRVHNLTVDGIHTYYVLAGEDPVLVHNCARPASRPRGLEPDTTATGPHSTFRRHGTTGEITHYATWQPQTNPMNPNAWELVHRVDVIGQPHFNKLLGEYVPTPHVQGPGIPGGVRPADPWEIPGGL